MKDIYIKIHTALHSIKGYSGESSLGKMVCQCLHQRSHGRLVVKFNKNLQIKKHKKKYYPMKNFSIPLTLKNNVFL